MNFGSFVSFPHRVSSWISKSVFLQKIKYSALVEKKLDALQGRAVWREQIKPRLVYPKTPAGGRALLAEQGILQEHTSKGSSDPDLFTGRGKAKDKKCKKKKLYKKVPGQ